MWNSVDKNDFFVFSERKDKKKVEDAPPPILNGTYVFANGDKYGLLLSVSI